MEPPMEPRPTFVPDSVFLGFFILLISLRFFGGAEGDRTPDLMTASQPLSCLTKFVRASEFFGGVLI